MCRLPPSRSRADRSRARAGCSLDTIAAKHEISRDFVHRHMKNHVSDEARADYLAAVPMSELAARRPLKKA